MGRWSLKKNSTAGLLNVRSFIVLVAWVSSLLVAVFPAPAQTKEVEIWDMEFTGKGDPRDVGFQGNSVNGSTFNPYDKFTNVAQATVAWAQARGYRGALFMGADEFAGSSLRAMRDSYASVRAGGSGIWVAGGGDLVDFMSDVVDVPVFAHPGAMAVDQRVQWGVDAVEWLLHPERTPNWDPEILLTPGYQHMIDAAHKNGNKIFTYFDPQGGQPFPEYQRRHRPGRLAPRYGTAN